MCSVGCAFAHFRDITLKLQSISGGGGRTAGLFSDACETIESRFVLELSKLKFADDAGAEAIRTLRERGAEIRGASFFIKMLINGDTG